MNDEYEPHREQPAGAASQVGGSANTKQWQKGGKEGVKGTWSEVGSGGGQGPCGLCCGIWTFLEVQWQA